MDIQKDVNDLILFNDKYKGLKYMLNFNRRYGLRNCKLYANIVMANLVQSMFLNINNLNDFKINHYKCKYEKNILFKCQYTYNTRIYSEEGAHYYHIIVKCLIYLIILEFITHNNIVNNELKQIHNLPQIVYRKICQLEKSCKDLADRAKSDIYLDLLDSQKEVIDYFKNCEKRFSVCKRLFEIDLNL